MKTIRIKDYYGKYHDVPVSDEMYEEWRKLQNETQRVHRAEMRHRSHIPMEHINAYVSVSYDSPIESRLIREESENEVYHILERLTPTQRERMKRLVEDKTLWELSKESSCSYNALKDSIHYAVKKIRKLMEN